MVTPEEQTPESPLEEQTPENPLMELLTGGLDMKDLQKKMDEALIKFNKLCGDIDLIRIHTKRIELAINEINARGCVVRGKPSE